MKDFPLLATTLLLALAPHAAASPLPCADLPAEAHDPCTAVPDAPPVEEPPVPPVPSVPPLPPTPPVPIAPATLTRIAERLVQDVLVRDGSLLGGMLPGAPCPSLPAPHESVLTLARATLEGSPAADATGGLPERGLDETCEEHRRAVRGEIFALPLP